MNTESKTTFSLLHLYGLNNWNDRYASHHYAYKLSSPGVLKVGSGMPRGPQTGPRKFIFTVIAAIIGTIRECLFCFCHVCHTFSVIKFIKAKLLSDRGPWSNLCQFRTNVNNFVCVVGQSRVCSL